MRRQRREAEFEAGAKADTATDINDCDFRSAEHAGAGRHGADCRERLLRADHTESTYAALETSASFGAGRLLGGEIVRGSGAGNHRERAGSFAARGESSLPDGFDRRTRHGFRGSRPSGGLGRRGVSAYGRGRSAHRKIHGPGGLGRRTNACRGFVARAFSREAGFHGLVAAHVRKAELRRISSMSAHGDEAGFAKAGTAAKNAIVLVHSNLLVTWDDLIERIQISAGNHRSGCERRRGGNFLDVHAAQPASVPAYEQRRRPARRFAASCRGARRRGAHRAVSCIGAKSSNVHFDMPNRVSGPVESENVVAEIRGREKPDEFVLVGAHLDSWELGTGALDNGCNAAMVIDAARAIRASGSLPRRSIRFVLFTGEEQGMLGSWAYARAHRAELDRMVAAVIFDNGNGRVTGYSLEGRKDVLAAVRDALAPIESLGVKEFTTRCGRGHRQFRFPARGRSHARRESGACELHAELPRGVRHVR